MVDNFLQNIIIPYSRSILIQIIALGIMLILAWLFQRLLQQSLTSLKKEFAQIPLIQRFVAVMKEILWPLTASIFNQLAIIAFKDRNWDWSILEWPSLFIGLWLLYRFFVALLNVNLDEEQAKAWNKKIILPIIFTVGILETIGVLDDILQLTLTPTRNIKITVGSILVGLIILAIVFMLSRSIRQYLERNFLPELKVGRALTQALSTLIGYTIIILGSIIALGTMGVNLTTVTVIVGGLSVGLGFGLQEVVSNFVSGFILMFERSIGPGDVLKIDNIIGTVQSIGVRSMIIKTQDNVELIVPNSKFMAEIITNLTRTEDRVRIQITIGVSYNSDPYHVKELLLSAVEHPFILNNPAPTVQFVQFGESSLDFELLVWTSHVIHIRTISSDLRFKVWEVLKTNNIEIPFPQRDIHIKTTADRRPAFASNRSTAE